MNNQPPSIKDWKALLVKACVNLYNHNQEYNLVYGVLGSLGVAEVEFLTKIDIVEQIDNDFYRWKDVNSQSVWKEIRNNALQTYFPNDKYRAKDRDIIMSITNKRQIFANQYLTTWESINNIPLTNSGVEIYKKFKEFDDLYITQ